MDDGRFNHLSRMFSVCPSRRAALHAAAALLTGGTLGSAGLAATVAKRRKKKLKRNEFGCVNVGGKCCGKNAVCCSGICRGKKPKKGAKDKSRCVGHDAQGCPAGQQTLGCGGTTTITCTTSTGAPGSCRLTTGNAGYCAGSAVAADCTHDTECEPGLSAGAACLACPGSSPTGTLCAGLNPAG